MYAPSDDPQLFLVRGSSAWEITYWVSRDLDLPRVKVALSSRLSSLLLPRDISANRRLAEIRRLSATSAVLSVAYQRRVSPARY